MNISNELSAALHSAKYKDVSPRKRDRWNDKVSIVLEFMLSINEWAIENNFCINSSYAHKQINLMLKSDKYDIAEISLSEVKTIMTEYKEFFKKVSRVGDGKYGKSVYWGYLINKNSVLDYINFKDENYGMIAEDLDNTTYGKKCTNNDNDDKMPWEE